MFAIMVRWDCRMNITVRAELARCVGSSMDDLVERENGEWSKMRIRVTTVIAVVFMLMAASSAAFAITWGEEDLGGEYPNVASVRGIDEAANSARFSCSGSLLHADEVKVVLLTAAHCTDGWIGQIEAGNLDSVGVSFDQNNVIAGSFSDATYYVRGGVPISFPAKDAPFEKFDYGLVVFTADAVNTQGETIADRWGDLTPVQLPTDETYLPGLIDATRKSRDSLVFTAVGYGTGEKFPIPSEENGPANPAGSNLDTFPIRLIADNLTYDAHNPINDVLRLSMNIAKGENGTCNGDSGGPIFYEDAALGSVQVSLVSGGDAPCRATNTGPGFSVPVVFEFIGCAAVPGDATAVAACVADIFDT